MFRFFIVICLGLFSTIFVQCDQPVVVNHGVLDGAPSISNLVTLIKKTYSPVVLIHGVLSSAKKLDDLKEMIEKAHPGTNVTAIDLYSDLKSLDPLWPQVKDFSDTIRPITQNAGRDGIHLICYSQGGVICRGILATMPDHNVKNFIALSSPLMGQFGDTSTFNFVSPRLREDVYWFCYENIVMNHVSICEYWNDPYHQDLYFSSSTYLAKLNNQTKCPNSTEWKNNFLKISNLIMIGGPDDGVITPWQSSQFGFYDSNLNVVEMENQKVYQLDYFGLRTLDQRNATHKYTFSGIQHTYWPGNEAVFNKAIEPWLT